MSPAAIAFAFLSLALVSTNAGAWFFFFIPPGVFSGGTSGSQCVKADAKLGDVLRSPSGNTATVKNLEGTSYRCKNPALPILATLEFSYAFNSRAGIDVPDGYDQKPLTDIQKFQGGVLSASNRIKSTSIYVRSQKRDVTPDPSQFARAIGTGITNVTIDGKTANEEELTINGMRAWRFELTAKSTGVFGRTFTYLVTVLEGDTEVVGITVAIPADDYPQEKTALQHLAETVVGIKADVPPVASPPDAATTAANESKGSLPTSAEAAAGKLRELNKLYKEGILNQQEYDAKKQEILKDM